MTEALINYSVEVNSFPLNFEDIKLAQDNDADLVARANDNGNAL